MKLCNHDVSIIVISFKSKKNVKNLLSLIENKFQIIIVENSKDLSLKDYYREKDNITFTSTNNIGFGAAINHASKFVSSKYFFVLNPDLSKISENFIKDFMNFAGKLQDNFGVLGPRYGNLENDKSLIQSDKKYNFKKVKCISGAAMFFLKKSFDFINGFDEKIFLYFEENDLCKRMVKNNKTIYQINSITIDHNRGNSFDSNNIKEIEAMKLNSIWHFAWSKFYYLKKNYTYIFALILVFPMLIRSIFKIFYNYIFNNKKDLKKYKFRLSGLINSILLKKSYKRPNL